MVFYKGLSFALFKNNKFYFLYANEDGFLELLDNPIKDSKYFFPCIKVIYEDATNFVFRIKNNDDLHGYGQLLDKFSPEIKMFHVKKYLFTLSNLPGEYFVRYSLLSRQIADISNNIFHEARFCIHSNEDIWVFLEHLISSKSSVSGWYFIQISCVIYQVYFCEKNIVILSSYRSSEISKYFELPTKFHDMRLISNTYFLALDPRVENDLITYLPSDISVFKMNISSECKIITNKLLEVKGEFCFSDSASIKTWLSKAYFCKRNFIFCLSLIFIFIFCCWFCFEKKGENSPLNAKNEVSNYKLKNFFTFLKNISDLLPVQVSLERIIYQPRKVSIFGGFSRFGALEEIKVNLGKDWLVSSYKQNKFVAINEKGTCGFS
ncbi:MAG: hypothetical protein VX335_04655 [Pseudomonadota bacterium]|nr:hypothetical protein [Pseudomonadota bacterium]